MKPIYHYATVTESLNNLSKMGYEYDYNIHQDEIKDQPHHFEIDHVYRYEGNSDPSDQAVVYGISSKNGIKGVYVAGFSANSDTNVTQILDKLCMGDHDQQCKI
ncbi:hypothetical protein H8R25_16845 [Flavobacterium sp. F-392]|uniref:Phosphoribosylpyrophosphate synthetase n=2 Tax=Flavobacterium muglaense TaxID=2764716 RepID=A0A923SHV8_9FLAO|nr:hypothetical protein [Flavobacterium muglaense]MBC5846089.1 hypothetical protein [Flavobacterium muglaense]